MTATKRWLFGAIAAAVVVAMGGWFLLIAPKRAEIADLQAQAEAQEQSNSQDRTELAVLKQQNKELPEKQAELAALREKIPASEDLPSYIRELQTLAGKSGVTLTEMTPSAPVTLGTAAGSTVTTLTPGALAAVNVDLRESDPARLTSEAFAKMVRQSPGSARAADGQAVQTEARQSYWQYGLLVMIAALVAESFVGRS